MANKKNSNEEKQPNDILDYTEEDELNDLKEYYIIDDEEKSLIKGIPQELDIFDTIEEQKKMLSALKQQAMLMTDKFKLRQVQSLVAAIETTIDVMNDKEMTDRVKKNIKTPYDLKFYVESSTLMMKQLEKLLQLDSVADGSNTATLAITVETPNGTKIGIASK
jgi:hypothetical protein